MKGLSFGILRPLRHRDYALLTAASGVSLLGDGFFYVALAWQVYEISNDPAALSLVGVAWTLPGVLFLLIGGVVSDRYDRRRVMIVADVVRAIAIGSMGVLSIGGGLELWHLMALITFVGAGDAFFNPASTAIVPDLIPADDLPAANALQGALRPFALRMAGPALAGIVVAALGPAPAFILDGASFLVSAVALAAIVARASVERTSGVRRAIRDIGDGLRFVLANPWCWATLVSALLSLLVFYGPFEVLIPYVVKNVLEAGPEALGLIFAVGGLGSVVASIAISQTGLPRRHVTAMYVAWSVGVALIAAYGVITELWQALAVSFVLQALFTGGSIVWTTLLQRLVPRELLGRVASLDWLVSTGFVPVSFALTGPAAATFGVAGTLIGAGLIGAVLMMAMLFVPGVRDPERAAAVPVPSDAVA